MPKFILSLLILANAPLFSQENLSSERLKMDSIILQVESTPLKKVALFLYKKFEDFDYGFSTTDTIDINILNQFYHTTKFKSITKVKSLKIKSTSLDSLDSDGENENEYLIEEWKFNNCNDASDVIEMFSHLEDEPIYMWEILTIIWLHPYNSDIIYSFFAMDEEDPITKETERVFISSLDNPQIVTYKGLRFIIGH